MKYLGFILKSALEDFSRNKIRTFLTSLGILIGVASVVLLVSLGLGLKRYISQQFESLGTNLMFVLPGNPLSGGGGFRSGAVAGISFDERDVTTIRRTKGVEIVMPFYVKFANTQANGNSGNYELIASTADIFPGLNLDVQYGEPFSKTDADEGRKRIVIGAKVAEKLYGSGGEALGKNIKIDDQSYKVIGVTKLRGGANIGGPSFDEQMYAPFKSAINFNPQKKYYAIYFKAASGVDTNFLKDEIRNSLLKRYKPDEFSVAKSEEILNAVNSIFSILNSVLVAIAAISLLVGGIGIMNIMYVSVVERIREIGIRRAIGATRRDILFQFLTEAVVLSLFGGLAGLLLAGLGVLAIQNFFPAYIDLMTVAVALGVSSAIGILFGVFPARKAAALSPIEAIRYE